MDPLFASAAIAFIAELIAAPIVVAIINRKLRRMDEKREMARAEQAEHKRQLEERREDDHAIVLAIARTMLLNNYEQCVQKGYYSIEEREVFHSLYENYCNNGGNGVIETIAKRIREFPTEPPKHN